MGDIILLNAKYNETKTHKTLIYFTHVYLYKFKSTMSWIYIF